MNSNEINEKLTELERLRAQMAQIEGELAAAGPSAQWVPQGFYTTYHILAGMTIGLIAAMVSLTANVIGSVMFDKYPLELIKIYLTFPMGEDALALGTTGDTKYTGFILAAGCGLYLVTGMFGGIPFHMILTRFFDQSSFVVRFVVATILGLGVWVVNFYGILMWLQPTLIGGNWILDMVPWYVAVFTHLVFGWSMLAFSQWGRFQPPDYSQRNVAAKPG